MSEYADIEALEEQLNAAEHDAQSLVAGLSAEQGTWRAAAGSWSIAECLEHLGISNRVYLRALEESAAHARGEGRPRRSPAMPGILGGWFVRTIEPPVKARFRAPRTIRPRKALKLPDALADFLASQEMVRAFLRSYAGIDLAGVRFPNPFIPGVRFSLATGLHVIAAHERRHLWQAWRVRRAAESAGV
jgi:hypothetical protein